MMEGLARRLSTGGAPSLPSVPNSVIDMANSFNLNLLQKATSQVQRCTSLVIFPSSTKTIPFTVPNAASSSSGAVGSPSARGPAGRVGASGTDDTGSTGGSEPPSPSSSTSAYKQGSVESLGSGQVAGTPSGSLDFRGAYSLGNIDPSLYKHSDEDDTYDIPDHHIGRVWFAVEYERETEKLMVTLIKAKNLPSRSLSNSNQCDPFVRIYLMPDERRYLQSKFKKKTCNPKFEESFVFQVSNKAIDERVMRLTLYDVDRHRRHQVIGHALYSLREHNYDSNERVVMWRDLEREIIEKSNDKGEVNISLSYNNHLERLTVGLFEGKNFIKTDGTTLPDYYMKVCLMHQSKAVKSKKTETIKRTQSPVFNESFTFKLPVNHLDLSSVTITAMQTGIGVRDKPVGRVVLGSMMFARGKELEHWSEMIANQKETITNWQTLT